MLAASCLIIGVFATFVETLHVLEQPIPWYAPPLFPVQSSCTPPLTSSHRYYPYYITVACLTIAFIFLLLWLIFQRRLLPSIVMVGAFIIFVMWLVGLVVISIQLWGPRNSISSRCNIYVFGRDPKPKGESDVTRSWLQQKSVCQSWQAVFAFGLIGQIFLFWIMVMAYSVFVDDA